MGKYRSIGSNLDRKWAANASPLHVTALLCPTAPSGRHLIEKRKDLLALHGRDPFQEIVNGGAPFQVVDQGLHRDACSCEHRRATQHVRRSSDHLGCHLVRFHPYAPCHAGAVPRRGAGGLVDGKWSVGAIVADGAVGRKRTRGIGTLEFDQESAGITTPTAHPGHLRRPSHASVRDGKTCGILDTTIKVGASERKQK